MERLALVEVLHDRLRQVRPHHPCESHFREGRELLGQENVRVPRQNETCLYAAAHLNGRLQPPSGAFKGT